MKNIEIVKAECNALDIFKTETPMPFWDRKVTLIVVSKDGHLFAAKNVGGKKALMENVEKTDTICCAWTGNYSTNIFPITIPDLKILKDR